MLADGGRVGISQPERELRHGMGIDTEEGGGDVFREAVSPKFCEPLPQGADAPGSGLKVDPVLGQKLIRNLFVAISVLP